jgi:hypothetical protein
MRFKLSPAITMFDSTSSLIHITCSSLCAVLNTYVSFYRCQGPITINDPLCHLTVLWGR